jgi:hypothetical protein
MDNKLIKVCGLYRNVSQKTGKEYFSGNLSFFAKVLILENNERKADNEPTHYLFVTEREQRQADTAVPSEPRRVEPKW